MEYLSESESNLARFLEKNLPGDKGFRNKFIQALQKSEYLHSNIDNFEKLFGELVLYEPQRKIMAYSLNNSKISFLSGLILPNIDNVQWAVPALRENNYAPDRLSSLFTDDIRARCIRAGKKRTALEEWNDETHLQNIYDDMTSSGANFTIRNIRQAHEWVSSKCSNFPINVAMEVYSFFGAKRILDTSAGWGDRAIAAAAWKEKSGLPVTYTGIDPNPSLKERYSIIFSTTKCDNFTFINEPAEDVFLGDRSYDLIFTSPPYYLLERYAFGDESSTQSTERYGSVIEWARSFFLESFQKAWRSLETWGNMVIVIEDSISKNNKTLYTEALMLLLMVRLEKVRFRGVFSYTSDAKKFRPMFCFEKISSNTDEMLITGAKRTLRQSWKGFSSLIE